MTSLAHTIVVTIGFMFVSLVIAAGMVSCRYLEMMESTDSAVIIEQNRLDAEYREALEKLNADYAIDLDDSDSRLAAEWARNSLKEAYRQ